MQKLSQLIRVTGRIYAVIVGLFVIITTSKILIRTGSLSGAWKAYNDMFGPYNISTAIIIVILFSPYLLLEQAAIWISRYKPTESKSFLSNPGTHYFDVEGSLVAVEVKNKQGMTVTAFSPSPHPFSIGSVLKNGSAISKEEFDSRLRSLS